MIFDMTTICIIMPHIRLKNNFTTPSVQCSRAVCKVPAGVVGTTRRGFAGNSIRAAPPSNPAAAAVLFQPSEVEVKLSLVPPFQVFQVVKFSILLLHPSSCCTPIPNLQLATGSPWLGSRLFSVPSFLKNCENNFCGITSDEVVLRLFRHRTKS